MEVEDTQAAGSMFHPVIPVPVPTGRRIVQFRQQTSPMDALNLLKNVGGTEAVSALDFGSVADAVAAASASDSTFYSARFGIATIGGGSDRAANIASVLADQADMVEDSRPEFWMFAIDGPPWTDTAQATWGLEATGAFSSAYDGSGIRLAVLDTGIDLGHPFFVGRRIVAQSFVPGETVDDVQGHGTHCSGTAVGRASTGNLPRYGVAQNADLYMGKVLNNRGSGREADIIAGIEWALDQQCQVISMSLGRPTRPEEPADPLYERIAAEALSEGALIIAAAGNDSDRRYGYVAPVGAPANSPSIMAVAAIDMDCSAAYFSSGGVGTGAVDVAAPGVGVFSTVPRPQLYKRMNGTSMACPHVAGAAALWAQSDPSLRSRALWDKLIATARPLAGPSHVDVGAGLVQAP